MVKVWRKRGGEAVVDVEDRGPWNPPEGREEGVRVSVRGWYVGDGEGGGKRTRRVRGAVQI